MWYRKTRMLGGIVSCLTSVIVCKWKHGSRDPEVVYFWQMVRLCVHVCACHWVCVHACAWIHACMSVYACEYVSVYVCMYVCMDACVCMHACVCCMYVCMSLGSKHPFTNINHEQFCTPNHPNTSQTCHEVCIHLSTLLKLSSNLQMQKNKVQHYP